MSAISIGDLKDAVKAALEANNVSAGAPVLDLSANMAKRVQRVVTYDPADIRPGAQLMPCVAIYTQSKSPKNTTIGPSMLTTKREALVVLTICGMVWNQNFQANIYDDKASRDLEHLMENIEEILRGSPQISGSTWQIVNDISYHTANFAEDVHFKVAFMDIQIKYFY